MDQDFIILLILVITFCITVLSGIVGVAFGKVDAQFVGGLITGGLLMLITTIIKDKTSSKSSKDVSSVVVPEVAAPVQPQPAP